MKGAGVVVATLPGYFGKGKIAGFEEAFSVFNAHFLEVGERSFALGGIFLGW